MAGDQADAPDPTTTILVVEDAAEVRRAVQRNLTALGMTVIGAENGEAGLAKLREQLPHVLLLDVNMPGLDGFDVLRSIRADPNTATLPVILMTARDDRASVRRGMSLGADDYLTKPFTADELRESVRARLAHHTRISQSHQEQTRAALWTATHMDSETGLPNGTAFRERLSQLESGNGATVITVELDRFDRVRRTFLPMQPKVIEETLRQIVTRLRDLLPASGELYRVGGSRFGVLAPEEGARELAEMIVVALRPPLSTESLEIRVTASVGLALWPQHAPDARTAAGHADTAALQSREAGGNLVTTYDPARHNQAYNRMILESGLHRALEREQLEVHYQPQVGSDSGELIGIEALIRWRHPELGMVSPMSFIPIAEETGLIVELGTWVLHTACADTARWSQEVPSLRVSVNVSALQLRQAGLAALVERTLDEVGLEAWRLKLELTESIMVQASDATTRELSALRDLGVAISIDDFGTGYSSLTNLRILPVAEVKIDRSFVRHVPDDRDNCSIVTAVIEMAHSLGLKVVAEGVEDRRQLDFLRLRGCDSIQGYYFSKPLPPEELVRWARTHQANAA